MNKIVILLVVVAVVTCNPIFVLDSLTNAYNTGTTFTQVYQKDNWATELDFAVYGWMKIDGSYSPRSEWSTILQLTQNPDSIFTGWHALGDQTLSCYVKYNVIQCVSYTKYYNQPNQYQNNNFINEDVGSWAFFYQGVSGSQQKQSIFFKFSYTVIQYTLPNCIHYPSAYYKLFIGQSHQWKYFPGTIAKVFIDDGATAYRESNFQVLQTIRPDAPNQPAVIPQCITIYDQCYYQGSTISICNKVPSLDLKKVKSIYVPRGSSFTLYGSSQYQGNSIKFTESKPCIDILEGWSFAQIASGEKTKKPTITKSIRSTNNMQNSK